MLNLYLLLVLIIIISQEKRTTKTIARSFSPEFSHLFDLSLPLTSHLTKTLGGPSTTTANLAQKLAEGSMLVEIWHQTPKGSSPSFIGGWESTKAESGVVTGRRLMHGAKDVLLGRAKVPLVQLLQKSTGLYAIYRIEGKLARFLIWQFGKFFEGYQI